eukprot:TRINITY_DN71_c0_g1_i6.p1 TRINITY_DN71_c0_g1~~TRINITY_DN71_c0_g1_i6.p1  ORF type:complete len:1120 (-),score=342.42 TRINITY_DN71_c0_g1_i6:77-3436(-)
MPFTSRGVLVGVLWAVVFAHSADVTVHEIAGDEVVLGESQMSVLRDFDNRPELTLGEVQRAATGVESLDRAGQLRVKSSFHKLALSLRSPDLRESALELAQMLGPVGGRSDLAESLGNETTAAGGGRDTGGMKLIYKKLDALRAKTINEGEEDVKNKANDDQNCANTQAAASRMIEAASKKTADNNVQMRTDGTEINSLRANLEALSGATGDVHKEFLGIAPERQVLIAQAMERIDERSKALGVLQKAIFLVCQRFKRFTNSPQCLRIKAMPDVDEPPAEEIRTAETLDQDIQSTKEFEKVEEDNWKKIQEADEGKEGNPNPENLPSDDKNDMADPEEMLKAVEEAKLNQQAEQPDEKTAPAPAPEQEETQEEKTAPAPAPAQQEETQEKKTAPAPAPAQQEETQEKTAPAPAPAQQEETQEEKTAPAPAPAQQEETQEEKTAPAPAPAPAQQAEKTAPAPAQQEETQEEKTAPAPAPAPAVQQEETQQEKQEAEKSAPAPAPQVEELGEAQQDTEITAVPRSELPALAEVAALAEQPQSRRVSTPLIELVLAIKKGRRKKVINLVQLLVNVKDTIQQEQLSDKRDHLHQLDELYTKAWQLQGTLKRQMEQKGSGESRTEECRVRLQNLMEDNENQRKLLNNQREIKLNEENRCAGLATAFGDRVSTRQEDLENLAKLKSLLRSLYFEESPTACAKGPLVKEACSGQDAGWCVFTELQGPDQRCSCNYGYHGELCEYNMCPGLGDIKFRSDASGVCSDRGTCSHISGMCESCTEGHYHGPKKACEYKKCPASVGADGTKSEDEKCSDHGECDKVRGVCKCEYEWSGDSCSSKKCPNSNSVLYPMESANACNGRGACDDKTGTCSCEAPYSGDTCEKKACPRDCSLNGGCDEFTGKCFCKKPFEGAACSLTSCPDDCNDGGWCDEITGKCLCEKGFSGDRCLKSTRCASAALSTPQANWYTQWDKPGWVTCPDGQALYGLYRSDCTTMSCLDSAKCAAPCEGEGDSATAIPLRHCYHSTETYLEFDVQGWSLCEPNYYVTGLYRSCDSLYCLNMFKCCNFKYEMTPTREVNCEEMSLASFDNRGWVEAPEQKFFTGFYRGKGHTLSSLDKARTCGWTRGY